MRNRLLLGGSLRCGDADFTRDNSSSSQPQRPIREIHPRGEGTSLLRVTIPV
jgi:hypothetical protein